RGPGVARRRKRNATPRSGEQEGELPPGGRDVEDPVAGDVERPEGAGRRPPPNAAEAMVELYQQLPRPDPAREHVLEHRVLRAFNVHLEQVDPRVLQLAHGGG